MLIDVSNIMHFLIAGNVDHFSYVILFADATTFDILDKGALTSHSRALRFNEWIRTFGRKTNSQIAS